jgi:hypothetical protein
MGPLKHNCGVCKIFVPIALRLSFFEQTHLGAFEYAFWANRSVNMA